MKPSNQVIQKANSKLTSVPLAKLRARDSVSMSVRESHGDQKNQRKKDENQKRVGEGFGHSITARDLGLPLPGTARSMDDRAHSPSMHT